MYSSRFRSFAERGSLFHVFVQFFAIACVAVDHVQFSVVDVCCNQIMLTGQRQQLFVLRRGMKSVMWIVELYVCIR